MTHFNTYSLCKGTKRINGYDVEFNYLYMDKVEYYIWWEHTEHTAKIHKAAWTKRLHGNAPSGTYYGSFTITLPNKHRETVRLYL